MRIRILIGLVFLLVVPATIFLVRLEKAREVKVGGKTVVAWALELDGPGNTSAAENVFRQVSPKAVANLIEVLERRDSLLKKPLQSIAPHLPTALRVGLFRTVSPQEAERFRLAAVAALAIMGPKATSAVPVLGKALRDTSSGVSMRAAMALGRIGPPAVPELTKALKDNHDQTRQSAIYGLSLAGADAHTAVPSLIEALQEPNPEIRDRAFDALSQIRHPSTVTALSRKLRHSSAGVRVLAARCLASMGPWAREAIPFLIEASGDTDSDVRQSAVEALGKIRPNSETVIAALSKALSDPRPHVRAKAAEALGAGGSAAASAVPALIERLKDEDRKIRATAAESLGAIGGPAAAALAALSQVAQDPDPDVSAKARDAIGQINKDLAQSRR